MTDIMSRPPGGFAGESGPTHKIVVIGNGYVGKSALTLQFFQNFFAEDHDPTIEDSYQQNKSIDDEWCVLDVLDTAGQDEYTAMREQYMRKGHGFLVIYSVIDRSSFEAVRRFHDSIVRIKERNDFPTLLVANKTDLVHQRDVSEMEGIALAKELNVKYIETSAKTRYNVEEAFHTLVRTIRSAAVQTAADAPVGRPRKPATKSGGSKGFKKCVVL